MLSIVQFEVYALQHGRWTLHARYPSEERQEAILDARTTELATGFPTKVIRETYFPEINDTELITAYISPKAKEFQSRHPQKVPLREKAAAAILAKRQRARIPLTPSQNIFRVLVAGGISLAAATLMIGVFNFLLGRLGVFGISVPADMHTVVLTYAYVLMFLFFFFSFYHSRLPLHRLLADLWKKSQATKEAVKALTPNVKLKPKHDRAASSETIRAQEDLKAKRGDLNVAPPQEILPAAAKTTAPSPAPAPAEAAKPELSTAEAKAAAETAKAAAERAKAAAEKARTEAAEQKKRAEEAIAAESAARKELERTIMRRFAFDVVHSALEDLPDDPVTRRGVALVLAGSATGLSSTARETPASTMTLVGDVLHQANLGDPAIDTFMAHYAEHVNAPSNQSLIAVGRIAVAHYLQGRADVGTVVNAAPSSWRAPFHTAAVENEAPEASVAIQDVYMLTELRADDSTDADEVAKDAAMGLHNSVIRMVLADSSGHEIKHTGAGIFARFETAVTAVASADEILSRLQTAGLKVAIGIIGNTSAHEDPLLSPTLFLRAQALTASTESGAIQLEAQVQDALQPASGKAATTDADAMVA